MASDPSIAVRHAGTEEPAPDRRVLTAGPLSAELDAGNLRYIRLGGHEAIRAISFIGRDRNWATYAPEIRELEVEETADAFRITYTADLADAEQRLSYCARIEGRADGSLSFEAEGTAETDWTTNRTGFVVLHPVEGVAGAPVTVTHTDGSVDRSAFPDRVMPGQPFFDIRSLAHEVAPGCTVTCTMEGDAYEMEDQRNWSDASFKTYVRPLSKPWPYTLAAGERLSQSVVLSVEGDVPRDVGGSGPVTVRLGTAVAARVPAIGLAADPIAAAGDHARAATVAAARPAFLVCRFDPGDGHDARTLTGFRALAEALDCEVWLEAVVPCRDASGAPTDDPAVLARDLDGIAETARAAGLLVAGVIPCPAAYLKSYQPDADWPAVPPLEAVYEEARRRFPGARIAGGMHGYFTELNRKRPPAGPIDAITHSTSPIVHAGDDASVLESLESLPSIFRSAKALAPGRGYRVGPSAIGMRMNPYGAGTVANPGNARIAMAMEDPRQRGLINAAWTLGYVARAAAEGVDAVALSAPTGPFGIVHHPGATGQPAPWFDEAAAEFPGGTLVYPVFHVVAGLAPMAGRMLRQAVSADPSRVLALAHEAADETGGGVRLWLANLTPAPVTVALEGAPSAGTVATIDAEGFVPLARDTDGLDRRAQTFEGREVALDAYAVARVDLPEA